MSRPEGAGAGPSRPQGAGGERAAPGDRLDRAATVLLGGGSLLIGAWGVAHPASLGRLLGASEDAARLIGWRDIGAGLLVLLGSGPERYLVRVVSDLGDAATFGRSRPWIGLGALGAAALGAAAALESAGQREASDRGSPPCIPNEGKAAPDGRPPDCTTDLEAR